MKFRIFDVERNEFFDGGFSVSWDGKYWYDEDEIQRPLGQKFVVSRGTSWIDAKGVEIFEGDIIKTTDYVEGHDNWIVKFGEMPRGGIGFYMHDEPNKRYYYYHNSRHEIIGNIYQV